MPGRRPRADDPPKEDPFDGLDDFFVPTATTRGGGDHDAEASAVPPAVAVSQPPAEHHGGGHVELAQGATPSDGIWEDEDDDAVDDLGLGPLGGEPRMGSQAQAPLVSFDEILPPAVRNQAVECGGEQRQRWPVEQPQGTAHQSSEESDSIDEDLEESVDYSQASSPERAAATAASGAPALQPNQDVGTRPQPAASLSAAAQVPAPVPAKTSAPATTSAGSAAPQDDTPGRYRIISAGPLKQLPVNAEFSRTSPAVAQLEIGSEVEVAEVSELLEGNRRRARLVQPPGWITLANVVTGGVRFAERLPDPESAEDLEALAREAEAAEQEAREQEAREQEAREQEAREREARERDAREEEAKAQAAREQEAREREAREQEAREQEAREREAREQEAREREAREREAREQEARDREALQTREREAREQEARDREAREREAREQEAREQEAREREAREQEAGEREAKDREAREQEAKQRKAREEREAWEEREARERESREREAREREAREREAEEKEAKEREAREQEAEAQAAGEREARRPPPRSASKSDAVAHKDVEERQTNARGHRMHDDDSAKDDEVKAEEGRPAAAKAEAQEQPLPERKKVSLPPLADEAEKQPRAADGRSPPSQPRAPAARQQAGEATATESSQEAAKAKDDNPGRYRVVSALSSGELQVTAEFAHTSAMVAKLNAGTEVEVVEVSKQLDGNLVRGRMRSPSGWITLVDMSAGGSRYATRTSGLSPAGSQQGKKAQTAEGGSSGDQEDVPSPPLPSDGASRSPWSSSPRSCSSPRTLERRSFRKSCEGRCRNEEHGVTEPPRPPGEPPKHRFRRSAPRPKPDAETLLAPDSLESRAQTHYEKVAWQVLKSTRVPPQYGEEFPALRLDCLAPRTRTWLATWAQDDAEEELRQERRRQKFEEEHERAKARLADWHEQKEAAKKEEEQRLREEKEEEDRRKQQEHERWLKRNQMLQQKISDWAAEKQKKEDEEAALAAQAQKEMEAEKKRKKEDRKRMKKEIAQWRIKKEDEDRGATKAPQPNEFLEFERLDSIKDGWQIRLRSKGAGHFGTGLPPPSARTARGPTRPPWQDLRTSSPLFGPAESVRSAR